MYARKDRATKDGVLRRAFVRRRQLVGVAASNIGAR
jgi:hypothetical protein